MSKASINSHEGDGEYNVDVEIVDGGTQQLNAWCADLTDDLTGEVGMLEIAGDIDKGRNIQPGFVSAAYDATRDGSMLEVQRKKTNSTDKSQHSAGIYYNWAIFPGWQKWRSKYRYGTITHIYTATDKCDLTLEACIATDTPDGKSLDVNQETSLGNVPIEYMDCDSSAFSDGDEVIVELSHDAKNEWINPKVIGFKSEPKACTWEDWDDDDTDICKNHTWSITILNLDGGGTKVCPSLPHAEPVKGSSSFDLVNGELSVIANSDDYWSRWENMMWWQESIGDPGPTANNLIIKVATTEGFGWADFEQGAWFEIMDADAHESKLWFACGDPGNCADYYIGSNGGAEQTLVLSDYGHAPGVQIVHVGIRTQQWEPDTLSFVLDYINFT